MKFYLNNNYRFLGTVVDGLPICVFKFRLILVFFDNELQTKLYSCYCYICFVHYYFAMLSRKHTRGFGKMEMRRQIQEMYEIDFLNITY